MFTMAGLPNVYQEQYHVFIKTDYSGFLMGKIEKCSHAREKQLTFVGQDKERGDGIKLTIEGLESARFLTNWATNHGYIRGQWLALRIQILDVLLKDIDYSKVLASLQQHYKIPGNIAPYNMVWNEMVVKADHAFLEHLLTMGYVKDEPTNEAGFWLELPRNACQKDSSQKRTKTNQIWVNIHFDVDEVRHFLNVYNVWTTHCTDPWLYQGA